jgi:hypothetical protein
LACSESPSQKKKKKTDGILVYFGLQKEAQREARAGGEEAQRGSTSRPGRIAEEKHEQAGKEGCRWTMVEVDEAQRIHPLLGSTQRCMPRESWASVQFNEKLHEASSEFELVGLVGALSKYNGHRVTVEKIAGNKYLARTQGSQEFLTARSKLSLVVRKDRNSFMMNKLRSNFSNKEAKTIFEALCLRTREAIRSHMRKQTCTYKQAIKDITILFDLDNNGRIDGREFCIGMKRVLDGNNEQEDDVGGESMINQYLLIYDVWDAGKIGYIDLKHFMDVCYNHKMKGELVRKLAVFTEIQRRLRIAQKKSNRAESKNESGFGLRRTELSKYRSSIKKPVWAKHVPNDGIHIRYGQMKSQKPKSATTDKYFRKYRRNNPSHNLSQPKNMRPLSAMPSTKYGGYGGALRSNTAMIRPMSAPARYGYSSRQ